MIYFVVSGLDDNAKYFFFFVIISGNMLFFMFWSYYFGIEIREFLIKKMGWVYLSIFLCGNREKLAKS